MPSSSVRTGAEFARSQENSICNAVRLHGLVVVDLFPSIAPTSAVRPNPLEAPTETSAISGV